jgi:hypothetical protein
MSEERNRFYCVTTKERDSDGMRSFHISIDYDPDTLEICGVMASGAKSGSETQALMIDTCRSWSRAMQDGASPDSFAAGVTRKDNGEPLSCMGLVADVLLAATLGLDSHDD